MPATPWTDAEQGILREVYPWSAKAGNSRGLTYAQMAQAMNEIAHSRPGNYRHFTADNVRLWIFRNPEGVVPPPLRPRKTTE
jgi:hypothetical protein